MIEIKHIETSGFANALYGMRLPKNSNYKSDTTIEVIDKSKLLNGFGNMQEVYKLYSLIELPTLSKDQIIVSTKIGDKDRELAERLVKAGPVHGKWLRQISVSALITAPMTVWWEIDTYKVGTTKNSSSRMHKITARRLTPDDFSWDDENGNQKLTMFRINYINHINELIDTFNELDDGEIKKDIFRELIQDLPQSFNFTATWSCSAQTCRGFYFDRKNHKQREMRELAQAFANLDEIGHFISLE